MSPQTRIPAHQRRTAIVEAAIPLFAQKGFEGVRTRELAEAAGVSEALLYKHFSSKEDLYAEIQTHFCGAYDIDPTLTRFTALPPSAEKLILGIFMLFQKIAADKDTTFCRLMSNSLLTDGVFAKTFFKKSMEPFADEYEAAFRAAKRSGDIVDPPIDGRLSFWLPHHVAVGLKQMSLSGKTVVDYRLAKDKLFQQATRFCLRGIGLTPEAVKKYYQPKKFTEALS
jgi:AcrR family transcriptional regulator